MKKYFIEDKIDDLLQAILAVTSVEAFLKLVKNNISKLDLANKNQSIEFLALISKLINEIGNIKLTEISKSKSVLKVNSRVRQLTSAIQKSLRVFIVSFDSQLPTEKKVFYLKEKMNFFVTHEIKKYLHQFSRIRKRINASLKLGADLTKQKTSPLVKQYISATPPEIVDVISALKTISECLQQTKINLKNVTSENLHECLGSLVGLRDKLTSITLQASTDSEDIQRTEETRSLIDRLKGSLTVFVTLSSSSLPLQIKTAYLSEKYQSFIQLEAEQFGLQLSKLNPPVTKIKSEHECVTSKDQSTLFKLVSSPVLNPKKKHVPASNIGWSKKCPRISKH